MADPTPISDELVAKLVELTNLDEDRCKEYLTATNGNYEAAAQAYFADAEEAEADAAGPSAATASSQSVPDNYTGPRTLDGRPAPQPIPTTTSRSAAKKPQKRTGLATLSSIGGGNAHDDDDDDDDDAEFDPRDPRNTYAGGEKSGLAVQDPSGRSEPKKLLDGILANAASHAHRPDPVAPGPSRVGPGAFRGSGQTLGGEGAPSRVIPDPNAPPASSIGRSRPQNEQVTERTLHLWQDGFSVDDGQLYRFDDPDNTEALRMIQQGRAPVQLMNVRFDEALDVKVQQHAENWRQLPRVYKPFGGEGRRLGSPVPGETSPSASEALPTPSTSNTTAAAAAAPATSARHSSAVDESQPAVSIRIQMPDGTRLPARFNTTQTVGDIYDFITRASPELRSEGWVLATTFPNQDHTDKSLVLGEMAEFKKGGTAVVKKSTS